MTPGRSTVRRLSLAGAATVVVAAVTAVTFNASAAETTARPRPHPTTTHAASPIDPPAGLKRLSSFDVARGTQTYTCTGGVFTGASTPEAVLVGRTGRLHHFAGPSWQSERDGSLVTATKVGEQTRPGTINELLLQINSHSGAANGQLAKAQYIQRLRTSGGVAPAGACTDGAKASVPYKATYVFWG
ncbi:DUF3455 domain-containing protein [Actinoplanes sp. NPDC051470]|uniref:DUF3455 domain-containing protein n=1 Tax=unclassified Actinoplanes TaxID=2626549 RepID=UPI00341EB822